MAAAEICITRHGETDWNIAGILQGWIDVPLNAQGRRQAVELAGMFAHRGFAAVWSSPLSRSLATAEIIADALSLPPPSCHEGLKERCFGVIQGIPKAELAESNPLLMQQILRRNPAAHFEDGETMDEFAERVLAALNDIGDEAAGQRILLITHGWVMDVITRHIGGLPRHTILNHKRKNGESVWVKADVKSIQPTLPPLTGNKNH
jgi:probable phosphoglycerate mutase